MHTSKLGFFLIILFSNAEAQGRVALLKERAYCKVGFGAFQNRGFKGTRAEYIKKNIAISPSFNIGIGYKLSDNVRSDINFQYTSIYYRAKGRTRHYKQNIRVCTGFINLYYDLYMDNFFSPYITAGIGVSRSYPSNLVINPGGFRAKGRAHTSLAWNVGVGTSLDTISKDYTIDMAYSYIDCSITKTYNLPNGTGYAVQKIRGQQGIISVLFKL